MTDDTPRTGLLAGGQPIPLEGVRVTGEIKDFLARVVIEQRYANREARPIEAVYVFPLDERAACCGFEALIGDTHVVGEVKEREKAFEEYDDALAAGHGAYLLDRERADIFTASIGNVPPGQEVLIRLTYVTELDATSDGVRFVLPTTVSPRYAPAEDRAGVGRPPAEAVNPPVAWTVPYGLELDLTIETPKVRSVASPSHPVAVELDGVRTHVRLGQGNAALDRDFVLEVKRTPAETPSVRLERDPSGRTAALLTFVPRFEAGDPPLSEVVFVVDRSGSMEGDSVEEARSTLQLCLRSLRAGMSFNIVGFGSSCKTLFPASRPYDDASLAAASRHVSAMQADLGGTEILPALEAVFAMKRSAELPLQLVVLTDGQVSNTEAVIALIRRHSGSTRVFAFGIGAGASHHLVLGIARAGDGAAEFIAPGERIADKVARQLRKLLAPALSNVRVDWGSLRVRQAPHHVPPVFDGGRLLVYGFVEGGAACDVVLRGTGASGPLELAVRVDPSQATPGQLVAPLAARTLIRDLEDGMSPLHDRRGSLQEGRRRDAVKNEIVRLAVAFGLASRETSFVAVERRTTPVEGEAQLRRVPVALTHGWGGLDRGLMLGTTMPGAPMAFATARAMPSTSVGMVLREESAWKSDVSAARAPRQRAVPTAFDRIVALQRADGSWALGDDLLSALGADGASVRDEMARFHEERERLRAAIEAVRARIDAVAREREACLKEAEARLTEARALGGQRERGRAAQLGGPAHVAAMADETGHLANRFHETAQQLGSLAAELRRLSGELELLGLELARLARRADPQAVATELVLEWLRTNHGPTRHQWELLAEKAEGWLSQARQGGVDTTS